MKLLRKPELSIKYSPESLYVINVAYGYEKNNPARRAGEKNNLAPILSEKNILARTKNPSPPLNIKWTVPNLNLDSDKTGVKSSLNLFGKMKQIPQMVT